MTNKNLYIGATGSGKTFKMLEELKLKLENDIPFIYLIEKTMFDYIYDTNFHYPLKLENYDINIYENINDINWNNKNIIFLINENNISDEIKQLEFIFSKIKESSHYLFLDELNFLKEPSELLKIINKNFQSKLLNGYSISLQEIKPIFHLNEFYISLINKTFNKYYFSSSLLKYEENWNKTSLINKLLNLQIEQKKYSKYDFILFDIIETKPVITLNIN